MGAVVSVKFLMIGVAFAAAAAGGFAQSAAFAQSGLKNCCQRAAAEKGHKGKDAQCYAAVCEQMLIMLPNGGCSTPPRSGNAYSQTLFSQCGISR